MSDGREASEEWSESPDLRGQEEGRKEEERAKVARVELNTREEKSGAEVVKEEGKLERTGKMELRGEEEGQ